jgi:hypothetical protein
VTPRGPTATIPLLFFPLVSFLTLPYSRSLYRLADYVQELLAEHKVQSGNWMTQEQPAQLGESPWFGCARRLKSEISTLPIFERVEFIPNSSESSGNAGITL